jgi:YVTN family beta-propeller protein
VTPDSVAVIDPGNGVVVDDIPVGESPGPIAASEDSLWVVNLNDSNVMKIDPGTGSVVGQVAVPIATGRNMPPLRLAVAGDDVWVWACHLTLYQVDPDNVQIAEELEVFRDKGAFSPFSCAVTASPGNVWVPVDYPKYEIVHATQGVISDRFSVPPPERSAMALGAGSLWLADHQGGAVRRLDPDTGALQATIRLGDGPTAMAYGAGAIWVANDSEDSVTRIDLRTNSVVRAISVGADPVALAVGGDSIWVANSGDGTVSRIDPATNQVTDTVEVGHRPLGVAYADGRVWVTVRS